MNIFPIDEEPRNCAMWSCDQHVVKIISEAVLVYSSALAHTQRELWDTIPKDFKYGPISLPLVKWAENKENRIWLAYYIYELNREYEYRYNGRHKAYEVFKYLANTFNEMPYRDIKLVYPKEFVQCMPKEFHRNNSIEAYKDYYIYKYTKGFKRPMRWTKREKPTFLNLVSV